MENRVEIRDLEFRYPGAAAVTLRVPRLKIQKGEKIFLFGPSGSGKTTLLELLAGVLNPQSGEIQIDQTQMTKISSHARDLFRAEHMGYIFQNFNLIPYLDVQENILLPFRLSKSKVSKKDMEIRARGLAAKLGIQNFLTSPITQLSVGQQQRVAAARAFLMRPALLLADEPTSSLDADHREMFLKALFDLCDESKTTVVFVSHDRSIQHLFDRQINLLEINKL